MEDKIIAFIKVELMGGEDMLLNADDDLLGSGLIESMAMMRLIQYVEDEFNVTVEPQDMTIENFMTVAAIAEYVSKAK